MSQPREGAVLGGCGFPVPNTMAKIVDIETDEALGPGETGELMVSGPQVMMGYYRYYSICLLYTSDAADE